MINYLIQPHDYYKALTQLIIKYYYKKLEWYGVRGIALEWFRSYLINRKQFVQYKDTKSSTHTIPCGVPQFSVLGPLLFIIYANDLPNCLTYSKTILFADDTTVYLNSQNIPDMFTKINYDLESLSEWFQVNKWSLIIGKTNYVYLNKIILLWMHTWRMTIKIGNNIIEQKTVVKFLGVYT